MVGQAKTTSFMLSEATVMVGPVDQVWSLNPAAHSIGLVKNFAMVSDPRYAEVRESSAVYAVRTANSVRCSMEVYEYTARNLSYGLGLDGANIQPLTSSQILATSVVGDDASPVTSVSFVTDDDVTADFRMDDWVVIQQGDEVHPLQLSANSTKAGSGPYTHTLVFSDQGIRSGETFAAGEARIFKVNRLDVGSKAEQPFLSAKVVAVMPEDQKPVTILIPKLKITKGFSFSMGSANFGNMPFEFSLFDTLRGDPFYNQFYGKGQAVLLSSSDTPLVRKPTVVAPQITLGALGLSASTILLGATPGTTVGTITGKTSGSVVSLVSPMDGTVNISGNSLVVGVNPPTGTGTINVVLREVLAGAVNTPHDSPISITVTSPSPTQSYAAADYFAEDYAV